MRLRIAMAVLAFSQACSSVYVPDRDPYVTNEPGGIAIPRSGRDARTRQRILDAHRFDPLLGLPRPHVTVMDNHVILEGTVRSDKARRSAEEAARRVPEVASVENRLQVVTLNQQMDRLIEKDLALTFALNPDVFGKQILFKVDKGIVTLSGGVPSVQAKEVAAQVAATTRGVTVVKNELSIEEMR